MCANHSSALSKNERWNKFPLIKVVVDHHLIMDGHHRYLASLLTKYDLERIPTLSKF